MKIRSLRFSVRQIFSANQAPSRKIDDRAFWNRWITLVFPDRIPEQQQNKNLIEELTTGEELSGILNLALDGLSRLQKQQQFTYQPSPEENKKLWMRWGDSVERFIDRRLRITRDKSDQELKQQVYEEYKQFCREERLPAQSIRGFSRKLKQIRGMEVKQRRYEGKKRYVYTAVQLVNA